MAHRIATRATGRMPMRARHPTPLRASKRNDKASPSLPPQGASSIPAPAPENCLAAAALQALRASLASLRCSETRAPRSWLTSALSCAATVGLSGAEVGLGKAGPSSGLDSGISARAALFDRRCSEHRGGTGKTGSAEAAASAAAAAFRLVEVAASTPASELSGCPGGALGAASPSAAAIGEEAAGAINAPRPSGASNSAKPSRSCGSRPSARSSALRNSDARVRLRFRLGLLLPSARAAEGPPLRLAEDASSGLRWLSGAASAEGEGNSALPSAPAP
mmetsp:Transcript_560/g.1283  ORF Transcript_560/g.1283 Transcript_560/m.1283 type:complete len:278 (+) Transcript_560:82-915(+)